MAKEKNGRCWWRHFSTYGYQSVTECPKTYFREDTCGAESQTAVTCIKNADFSLAYFPREIKTLVIFSGNTVCPKSMVQLGLTFTNATFCPHSVFMCFVWIWEETAIISLYSINWLVFITETECVYCAVRTGSLYIILRSAHTVYLCVLCGSEKKQRLFPYTALTDWFL